MRRGVGAAFAAALLVVLGATPLPAQWVAGVHHVRMPTAAGGGTGFGVRGGLDFGPIAVVVVADRYEVPCPESADRCHGRAGALHASVEFPAPLLRPYLLVGVGLRDGVPTSDGARRQGLLGLGLRLGLAGIDLFGEATAERISSGETPLALRVGVRF